MTSSFIVQCSHQHYRVDPENILAAVEILQFSGFNPRLRVRRRPQLVVTQSLGLMRANSPKTGSTIQWQKVNDIELTSHKNLGRYNNSIYMLFKTKHKLFVLVFRRKSSVD